MTIAGARPEPAGSAATLSRRTLSECVGTALLVAAAIGSDVAASRLSPHDVGTTASCERLVWRHLAAARTASSPTAAPARLRRVARPVPRSEDRLRPSTSRAASTAWASSRTWRSS